MITNYKRTNFWVGMKYFVFLEGLMTPLGPPEKVTGDDLDIVWQDSIKKSLAEAEIEHTVVLFMNPENETFDEYDHQGRSFTGIIGNGGSTREEALTIYMNSSVQGI
jgi:hypothetical protein